MERIFEYRIRPNRAQETALFKVLAASRRLYNDALAEWKEHFDTTGKYLNIYEQDKRYNQTTYPDVPAVVTDQVLKRLHRSLTAFFKGRKEDRNVTTPTTKVAGFSVQPATYWPPSPKAVPPPLTGGVTWGNAR